jgi:multicomponent Na+:H+ antiporter subunit A
MTAGPLVLAASGLLAGIFITSGGKILEAIAGATMNQPISVKLSLWHGFTPAFTLSLITLALGTGHYFIVPPVRLFFQKLYQMPGPKSFISNHGSIY